MSLMLVHASISENGNAGWDGKAKAGDQTGKEVCTRTWYDHSPVWQYVIRWPDAKVAQAVADALVKMANNPFDGYDQKDRMTLRDLLEKYGWDVDKAIASGILCEADCSSFVFAGYCIEVPAMRSTKSAPATKDMASAYKKWGFTVYNYTAAFKAQLRNGDILVSPGYHTAIVASGGVSTTSSTTAATSSTTQAKENSVYFETFVENVQSALGMKVTGKADASLLAKTVTISAKKNSEHAVVLPVQAYLYDLGYTVVGTPDGEAGPKFTAAVKAYQRANGCTVDGEITAKGKTWKKLLGLA